MPELPEVQTTVSDLKKKIVGLRIIDVWTDTKKLLKRPSFELFKKQIKNTKIEKIDRRGKNILIYLDSRSKVQDPRILLVHQKMTGHLLYGLWIMKQACLPARQGSWVSKIKGPFEEKVNQYIHLLFYLSNGKMLALSDLRKFAKVVLGPAEEILDSKDLKDIGLEPLDKSFTLKRFKEALWGNKNPARRRRGKIKQVLMDQNIIAGIGNIYADEILWKAKINPLKPVDNLKDSESKKIYDAMKEILKKAVKLRGTSMSDYRDPEGKKGNYANVLSVYQREGAPCYRCGTKIKRIRLGSRSAHYCPTCQKI
ncbi:MAG: bifunctional DNA-formamidopyrimidine glycosylase/DNA-(apurinic or apyrimidinic site) lyase [Candidatus Paceibacterota bacterium]|jgi:formamidopyrimidine-DNA glycosylase